jgi:hypothetical protein
MDRYIYESITRARVRRCPDNNSRDVCLDVRGLLSRREAKDGEELEVHLQHVSQRTPSIIESPRMSHGSGLVVHMVEMGGESYHED